MTLPAVRELMDYWAVHPPLHLVVAAALGCGRNARAIPEPPADFSDLAALAPTGMLKLATPS
jgi:hypothetical protein